MLTILMDIRLPLKFGNLGAVHNHEGFYLGIYHGSKVADGEITASCPAGHTNESSTGYAWEDYALD